MCYINNVAPNWIGAKDGPLTMEIVMYKKEEVIGIAILCNDPRPNLWKRVKELIIPHGEIYAPIMCFGGPIPLVYPKDLSTDYNWLLGQIHFGLSKFPNAKKLLGVNHDCGYYDNIPRNFTITMKMEDTEGIGNFLHRHFKMPAAAYFAHSDYNKIKLMVNKQ